MDLSKQKEEFNYAYISALAAHAGLNRADFRVDDDSVDVTFQGRGHTGGTLRNPQIQIQLKCTSQNLISGDVIKFPLSRKNYDDLRGQDVISPRYLVVLLIPEDNVGWIRHNDDHIALFNLCYWLSLRHADPINNIASITVDIPLAQRLTTDVLGQMMQYASMGESL